MSILKGVKAYLSGPIEHGEDAVDWRIGPKKLLKEEFKIDLFDPSEDPKQQWAEDLYTARLNCNYDEMARIAKQFVQKDLTVVNNSQLVISYLPYRVPTTGTHHEIIESSNNKKPTLLVCPQGKQFVPLWYYGFINHEQMFGSWDALYEYLRDVEAGKHTHNRRWHYLYKMI